MIFYRLYKLLLNPLRSILNCLEKKTGKRVIRQTVESFATRQRTLDLGCGQSSFKNAYPNLIGIDIVQTDNVHVIADAHCLPFASRSFKQIICSEVIEHLENTTQAVEEMARVLENKGRLVVTIPFIYPIHEAPNDYYRFTMFGLRRLFSPYFIIQKIKALYSEEQTLAILLQRIAYQRHDSPFKHYLYLLLSHLIFKFFNTKQAKRYQNISRRMEGEFLTAGYLLVATKRKKR